MRNLAKAQRTTKQILEDANRMLSTVGFGYKVLAYGSPKNKMSGLMNLVVFGRAVTNVLQNLRSTEPSFDEWYKKYVEEMKNSPELKYFYDLRSVILKEGRLKVGTSAYINHLNVPNDLARLPKPPPFLKIKSFFIGDSLGGTGYEVLLSDGSTEKYYIELPQDIGKVDLIFSDVPSLKNISVVTLSRQYLEYLTKMVKDVNATFGEKEAK